MSDFQRPETSPDPEIPEVNQTWVSLDDEQRIKVLSPTMLVLRRFVRNQLAIVGSIFITLMFLFSFVGGWLMPYGESQVFTEVVDMSKLYAGVTINQEYRYVVKDGTSFNSVSRAGFINAINNGQAIFEGGEDFFYQEALTDESYLIMKLNEVAQAIGSKIKLNIKVMNEAVLPEGFEEAFTQAVTDKKESFDVTGQQYLLLQAGKIYRVFTDEDLAIASFNIMDFVNPDAEVSLELIKQAEVAKAQGQPAAFDIDGVNYEVELDAEGEQAEIFQLNGSERSQYAVLSRYVVNPLFSDVHISLAFKEAVKEAIDQNQKTFLFKETNPGTGVALGVEEEEFSIERQNQQWIIKNVQQTQVVLDYEYPSKEHLMGTDANGMDILTRLMYGGRISLMIGFIVVLIETFIGVILGGIAGYFGKWIDNLLMRLVDVFNSIPSIPIIIIIGAVMDGMRVDPQVRMIYLMLILGFLGWPSIARLVRGQILSLREQEFMVATEATGLSVSRRIFRHLVPNVIPQLIVISTMSLGGVILTESTLSFLGLGVKFPFASWGNIINAVSNVHVMSNYWFVWIPAGFLILITVLGFNFIGDGLRDAFDPKMKR